MPQLMPLYWIMSSFFVILLMMMFMKMYGNYLNKEDNKNMNKLMMFKIMWYW